MPLLADALEHGVLSFEKVLQLARYLEPNTEEDEIRWARKARLDAIKRKADALLALTVGGVLRAGLPTVRRSSCMRASREVPRWLRRQLKKRDGGCVFPGHTDQTQDG